MRDEDRSAPTSETEETTKKLTHGEDLAQLVPGFRLLQKLGEGGMGEVFEAEQVEPVRRKVALKLIKRGMESKEVLARFDSERQALALMSHPNIAQVFDAGTTSDGRPYFVMEFVQGVPVTRYCDTSRLATNERLELFTQICDGVQHAHHKGVIHRDLKPSNVLVKIQDSKAVPKIIDFGVAKAISQRLTEQTLFTAIGEFIGTPEYMSPEQAEMTELDIDTRTDVYSLGVVLYELLVGAQPFDGRELRRSGFDEMRRKIREDEPLRPSVRLSAMGEESVIAAENRSSEPSTLSKKLHGDLDWITMKAIEKDRTRRYDSPGELAADIGRQLRNEPVLAGPPSTLYRVKKFVRRHAIGVAASALLVLALVLGIVGTTIGIVRAKRAERAASREAETARQVSDFLIELFEVSNPVRARGETITAREILDQGARRIRTELSDQPLVQATLMGTMGQVFGKLGLYDPAQELLEEALSIRRKHLGDSHPDVAESMNDLAHVLEEKGNHSRAQPLYEDALAIRTAAFDSNDPRIAETLNDLAVLLGRQGQFEKARTLFERALAIRELSSGPQDLETARVLANFSSLAVDQGEYDEAKRHLERSLDISLKALDSEHPDVARTLDGLARVEIYLGNVESARQLNERALAIREKTFGSNHPMVAASLNNLGNNLEELGEYEAATLMFQRALKITENAYGPDHADVARVLGNLGIAYAQQEMYETAKPFLERALAIREKTLGPDHGYVGSTLGNLSRVVERMGDYDEALRLRARSVGIYERALGPDHPAVADGLSHLAELRAKQGSFQEALSLYERALNIRIAKFGPDHPDVAKSQVGVAIMHTELGDLTGARDLFAHALETLEGSLGVDHPSVLSIMQEYADLMRRHGEEGEAQRLEDRIAEIEDSKGSVRDSNGD